MEPTVVGARRQHPGQRGVVTLLEPVAVRRDDPCPRGEDQRHQRVPRDRLGAVRDEEPPRGAEGRQARRRGRGLEVERSRFRGDVHDEPGPGDGPTLGSAGGSAGRTGCRRPFAVFARRDDDPFTSLVEAREDGVELVVVEGAPVYGTPRRMRDAGATRVGGAARRDRRRVVSSSLTIRTARGSSPACARRTCGRSGVTRRRLDAPLGPARPGPDRIDRAATSSSSRSTCPEGRTSPQARRLPASRSTSRRSPRCATTARGCDR